MTNEPLSLPELRREGFRALLDRLGPADALRFLQEYDAGHGDYTREREALLKDLTLDDLLRSIEERRQSAKAG
jgi:hypothetical protein